MGSHKVVGNVDYYTNDSRRASHKTLPMTKDQRLDELQGWLRTVPAGYGLRTESLRPASDDASFRRYFRVDAADTTMIAMDAPPPQEDCRPFVHAAQVLGEAGLSVPTVHEADLERGFLLLRDLGTRTYLDELSAATAPRLYGDALTALTRLQQASRGGVFPDYDRALLERELMLFPQWYIGRHRGFELASADQQVIARTFETLLANLLSQPRTYVHRDYHSRNLMVLAGVDNPGVLDFQDAVFGPITYDLVSLLRDAYVVWPEEQVIDWAVRYWEMARRAKLPVHDDFGEFYRDFEWMGLQRHLKVLGIFARLNYRDGKSRYLADLPLVLEYVERTARRYVAFTPLMRLIERIEGRAQPAVGYTF